VAASDLLRLPLVYQQEVVGELLLASRAPGETFSAADRRLLEDLGRQVGIAAHAVRLTADLQRARTQLVTAREEERRRMQRDLHDGLGPALSSVMLKLAAARRHLPTNSAADALVVEARTDLRATLADVRRLVYELRPPALDQLGLMHAIREQAERCSAAEVRVQLEAPECLPALPAAVEVAAFRIAQEALTNVVRHARARACSVRLALEWAESPDTVRYERGQPTTLRVEICDDGCGLLVDGRPGVGLASLRERAEELGGTFRLETRPAGGTRIVARLPLPMQETPA
jgi:signal transduction histidine kinase